MTALNEHDRERFKTYSIFQDLSDSELEQFLADTSIEEFDETRSSILGQGDPPTGLGIVLSGKVKIFKHDAARREHFLSVLKEGDFFGEMALLDACTRSANVQALERTRVLWLKADDFKRFLSGHSPLMAKILSRMVADLSRRLRLLDERYVFIKSYLESRA